MGELILQSMDLTRPWAGVDPFLFCAHHLDRYPKGNEQQGLDTSLLSERPIGNDFSALNGYSMYYGEQVPGFPCHPHRGFETITIVLSGHVDHADSMGAMARYGQGDVQWLTAGAGVQHSEMFPLIRSDQDNPLELFQIWLNLPAKSKMVPPSFKMMWADEIPHHRADGVDVSVIAGAFTGNLEGVAQALTPIAPPPDSWAADVSSDVAIWLIDLALGASVILPMAQSSVAQRTLYVFEGDGLAIQGQRIGGHKLLRLNALQAAPLQNLGDHPVRMLMMQGVPIGEPVAAAGPFVMNTPEDLQAARRDFAATQFGGWPWPDRAPVHRNASGRFVLMPDGTRSEP